MGKNSWLIGAGDSDMKFFHLLGGKVYSEIYSHGCTEIPVGSCSGCPWVISLMTHGFLVSPFSAFHSRFLWLLPQINHLFQAAFSGKPKLGQQDFWILQWTESCFVLLFEYSSYTICTKHTVCLFIWAIFFLILLCLSHSVKMNKYQPQLNRVGRRAEGALTAWTDSRTQ